MNECLKLLGNRWDILIFKNKFGEYGAFAVKSGESIDQAIANWRATDAPQDLPFEEWAFTGPERYAAFGKDVDEALRILTEKVLFRRFPK